MTGRESLLFKLYGCPTDPSLWTSVLDGLCRETGARSAVIQTLRVRNSRIGVERTEQDSNSRMLGSRAEYGSQEANPRLDVRCIPRGLNRLARDADLFDPGDAGLWRQREWLAQLGLDHFVGYLRQIGDDSYLALALHRAGDDREDFSDGEIACLSSLAPHIVQAFRLGERVQAGSEADVALRQVVDRFRCALILCDADGRPHLMNRSAKALLASSVALRLQSGRLRAGRVAETRMLLDAVSGAALAGPHCRDRYIVLGEGTDTLHAVVQPFRSGDQAFRCPFGQALVAVTPTCGRAAIQPAAIVTLLGLTPAEGHLVAGLVAGMTLEQYAQRRGVSPGTVRGQVKQVFAKTGVARQSELIRLVLSSAATQFMDRADPDRI